MLVLDLAAAVQAFGPVVDDILELVHDGPQLVHREHVLDDQESVLEVPRHLVFAQSHDLPSTDTSWRRC